MTSSSPEIVDCACGRDHQTMPTDDGFELVCRIHKRHHPCRKCARQGTTHFVPAALEESP